MTVVIEPLELRSGVSIAATFSDLPSNASEIEITPKNKALSSFYVPLKNLQGPKKQKLAEFTILSPGNYEMRAGDFRHSLIVAPQVELSFQREFGLSVVLIFIFLMGIILWGIKVKNQMTK